MTRVLCKISLCVLHARKARFPTVRLTQLWVRIRTPVSIPTGSCSGFAVTERFLQLGVDGKLLADSRHRGVGASRRLRHARHLVQLPSGSRSTSIAEHANALARVEMTAQTSPRISSIRRKHQAHAIPGATLQWCVLFEPDLRAHLLNHREPSVTVICDRTSMRMPCSVHKVDLHPSRRFCESVCLPHESPPRKQAVAGHFAP